MASCVPRQGRLLTRWEYPPAVVLEGTARLTDSGELVLTLAGERRCERMVIEMRCRNPGCSDRVRNEIPEPVPACSLGMGSLVLTPPWGERVIVPVAADDDEVSFPIDWGAAEIDPRSPSAAAELARMTWTITGEHTRGAVAWKPGKRDVQAILRAIAAARDIAIAGDDDDDRPSALSVVTLEVDGEALTAGEDGRLALTLHNDGPGTAARVSAVLKSSTPALHGVRFDFGAIPGGQDSRATADVALPASPRDETAAVVVLVSTRREDNAARSNHALAIAKSRPKPRLPVLQLACRVEGKSQDGGAGAPEVSPGQEISIYCDVENVGPVTARAVELTALSGDVKNTTVLSRRIASKRRAGGRVELRIPAEAAVGSDLRVVVLATARGLPLPTEQAVEVRVVKKRRCPSGAISRDEYERRIANAERAREVGALTQKEFDEFRFELVACLE